MKNNRVVTIVGMLAALTVSAEADVILPGYHVVQSCAKIQNLDAFSDIVLISCIKPMTGGLYSYVITQDSCMDMGYKFSEFSMVWVLKSYFDSVGLSKLPLDAFLQGPKKTVHASSEALSRIHLVSGRVAIGPLGVPDSNPLRSQELFYNLYSANSTISVYLAKKVSHLSGNIFNIETFSQPITKVISNGPNAIQKNMIENVLVRNGIFAYTTTFSGKLEMTMVDCRGKTIARKSRTCVPGNTYVADFAGMRSGLYWLRLKSPNVELIKRLTFVR